MCRSGGSPTPALLRALLLLCLAAVPCYGCSPTIGQRPKVKGGNDAVAWQNTGINVADRDGSGNKVKCSPGQICTERDQGFTEENNESNENNKAETAQCDLEKIFGEENKEGGHPGFRLEEDCGTQKPLHGIFRTIKTAEGKTCIKYDADPSEISQVGINICGTGFINFLITILGEWSQKNIEISRIKAKCPREYSPREIIPFICSRVNHTDPRGAGQPWRVAISLQLFLYGGKLITPRYGYFFSTPDDIMTCIDVERCRYNLYDCTSQSVRNKGEGWWKLIHPFVLDPEPDMKNLTGKIEVPEIHSNNKNKYSDGDKSTKRNEKGNTKKRQKIQLGKHRSVVKVGKDAFSAIQLVYTESDETQTNKKNTDMGSCHNDDSGHCEVGSTNEHNLAAAGEPEEIKTLGGNNLNPEIEENMNQPLADDEKVGIHEDLSVPSTVDRRRVEKNVGLQPENFVHEATESSAIADDQCTKDEGSEKQPMCLRAGSAETFSTTEDTVDHGINNSEIDTPESQYRKVNLVAEETEATNAALQDGKCQSGYYLSNAKCIDIDECQTSEHRCEHLCVNTQGGYKCLCPSGFKIANDGISCEDEDECDHSSLNVNCHSCENTLGSYRCICNAGYTPAKNKKSCEDINECLLHTSGCSQGCMNEVGSFSCNCEQGYFLLDDKKTCEDLNECRLNISGCAHGCKNTAGSFQCSCREGFYLAEDGKSCLDIDECLRNTSGCSHICENTIGSFVCKCKKGYFLMEDKKQCDDRDECAVDENGKTYAQCSHKCTNLANGFECNCPEGYGLSEGAPTTCVELPQGALSAQAKPKAGGLS